MSLWVHSNLMLAEGFYAMWKFIVDVVHEFGSSLQPDVGWGFLRHVEIHSWCCALGCTFTTTWCWPRVFTRLQRVLVFWDKHFFYCREIQSRTQIWLSKMHTWLSPCKGGGQQLVYESLYHLHFKNSKICETETGALRCKTMENKTF